MSDYNKPIRPVITGMPNIPRAGAPTALPQEGAAFADLLKARLNERQGDNQLTLSKHAQARATQRGIELTEADMLRLGTAVQKARDKGLGDTLVMMDSNAFIINVPNRVVVTMVDQGDRETVFTNIDGAVII
jgi:flagellar operon protein